MQVILADKSTWRCFISVCITAHYARKLLFIEKVMYSLLSKAAYTYHTPHTTYLTTHRTSYITLHTLHSTQHTPHTTHYTRHTTHDTQYTTHHTRHTPHPTPHIAHHTPHTPHPTPHTTHRTSTRMVTCAPISAVHSSLGRDAPTCTKMIGSQSPAVSQ